MVEGRCPRPCWEREAARSASEGLIEQFDDRSDLLVRAVNLRTSPHVQKAARVRRGDDLRLRELSLTHFFRKQVERCFRYSESCVARATGGCAQAARPVLV